MTQIQGYGTYNTNTVEYWIHSAPSLCQIMTVTFQTHPECIKELEEKILREGIYEAMCSNVNFRMAIV